ncbi:MAG: DUF3052 domain-containing protein [Gemmatimonadetes bacterium]|nr:DUF3052 domain-containing protein [Gemmatimonadota bacterium]
MANAGGDRPPIPEGYSGTPLVRKLGIEPGARLWLVRAPEHYLDLLGPLPEGARPLGDRARNLDFVHVFAKTRAELSRGLASAKRRIVKDGMIWASWPKKTAGVPTELDGNVVRELGLAAGLVDVKVCAVDETWSGLKFVYRLEDR